MISDPLTSKRRHFRFSLRTLVLLSLLCGSAMWLWRNWGPWVRHRTIEEKGWLVDNPFVDFEGRLHLTLVVGDQSGAEQKMHVVRDVSDGRQISCEAIQPANRLLTPRAKFTGITAEFYKVDVEYLLQSFKDLGAQCPKYDCFPPFLLDKFTGTFVFSDSTTVVVFGDSFIEHDSTSLLSPEYHIWKLARPPTWDGVFWLPQFWLVLTFIAIVSLSLYRDQVRTNPATGSAS